MLTYNSPVFEVLMRLLAPFPDKFALSVLYRSVFDEALDWQNPNSMAAWINVQKLRNNDALAPYTDKIAVKRIVRALIGDEYVIPTLWSGTRPQDIPFDSLPYPVVFKTNHRSSGVFLVRSRAELQRRRLIGALKRSLRYRHGQLRRERFYDRISPTILIEPMLRDDAGNIPKDYKFHVVNGRVELVGVDYDRHGNHKRGHFDRNWQYQELVGRAPPAGRGDSPPENLAEMIAIAEKLAAPFTFARLDLYTVGGRIKFSEFTFTPVAGFWCPRPRDWDLKIGEMLMRTAEDGPAGYWRDGGPTQ